MQLFGLPKISSKKYFLSRTLGMLINKASANPLEENGVVR